MFIPPEGTMQFEVVNDYSGKQVSKLVLRVIPAVRTDYRGNGCTHDVYRVISVQKATVEQRKLIEDEERRHPRKTYVCACIGRIIE